MPDRSTPVAIKDENQLCKFCKGISVNSLVPHCLPEQDSNGESVQVCYQHHATFNDLKSSATKCSMCRVMYLALQDRNRNPSDVSERFLSSGESNIWLISGENMFFDLSLPKHLSQMRVNVGSCGKLKSIDIGLYAHPADPLAVSGDVVGRRPATHAGSAEVLTLMKGWLQDCLANHSSCKAMVDTWSSSKPVHKIILPKRLLQLSPKAKPRLVSTDKQEYQYAALSYCWGTSHPVVTTRDNYGKISEGLGKTIKDAVSICFFLGLEYLWVDALCIVQNDNQDWQDEAAKMGEIYRNATITISATGARDTSIGCLRQRPKPLVEPVELLSQCSKGNKVGKMIACPKPGSIKEVLDRSPLNNRGWCLQERILSRRIIHFAEDQLYWECETLSRAEDGTILDATSVFKRELSKANSERTVLRAWHNLVEDYSARNLTHPSDMLPALAGLADAVRRRLSTPIYYAGLWKQDLPFGLLWSSSIATPTTISPKFRAPSWSWASILGPITWSYRAYALILSHVEEHVEILHADVTVCNSINPLGEVRNGALGLRGRLKNMKLPKTGNEYQQRPWKPTDGVLPAVNDKGEEMGEITFDDHSLKSYPTLIKCLMILKASQGTKTDSRDRVFFLAIEPVGKEKNKYRRIGAGYLRQYNYFDNSRLEVVDLI